MSKGHACLHITVFKRVKNYFDKILNTYGENDSILMSHSSHKVPGVVFSTGSLGHGLPVSVGNALSNKIKKNKIKHCRIKWWRIKRRSNWEALLFASHHKLDNLVIIIDYNKIQSLDFVKKTLILEPLKNKFLSFGLKVKIIDGHNHSMISKSLKTKTSKPLVIIANTTKGKGIKFMENKVLWHYKSPNQKEVLDGLKQIEKWMRNLFINRLVKEASKNKRIVLLVGDLGYNVVEPFKNKFPNRFYNVGISEQSMIGIASGLALNGYHVFVYSIANFCFCCLFIVGLICFGFFCCCWAFL